MSDIIGQIDGALADWTTSKDAMRWTPEPPTAPAPPTPGVRPRFNLATGRVRITCGEQLLYEGPIQDWPTPGPDDPPSVHAD